MSKISERAAKAFISGAYFQEGETLVNSDGEMWLYKTMIAENNHNGTIQVRTLGHNTKTTFERLNAIPGVEVHMTKGKLFLNGREWSGDTRYVQLPEEAAKLASA
jgi:hypothetical protein